MAIAAFLLLSLAVGLASAQTQGTVQVSADTSGFRLDPAASESATLTVTSQPAVPNSPTQGPVTLTVTGVPPGWTARVNPVTVPAGGTQTAVLTVQAPAERPTEAAPLSLVVTATLPNPTGPASTSSATFELAMTPAPAPPPPPPPPPDYTWAYALAGALVLVALAGLLAWYVRRRETGIEVASPIGEKEARPGYDAFVPIEVRNASTRPRVAKLYADSVPAGWTAATSLATIPLDPGQAVSLWLAVRPPIEAEAGEITVSVLAKPSEARTIRSRAAVTIRVVPDGEVHSRLGKDLVSPLYSNRPDHN
ncbi:MAG TPA: hypothetical protein VM681_11050 [Candidatus Thermoplasmatota archaeon]|nr:hypothetical protein [Candidatus Thermoplasmatota archaeon]